MGLIVHPDVAFRERTVLEIYEAGYVVNSNRKALHWKAQLMSTASNSEGIYRGKTIDIYVVLIHFFAYLYPCFVSFSVGCNHSL